VVSELVLHQNFLSIFKATHWFPCVVANGVSFPFDEIPVSSTPFLVAHDCFYLNSSLPLTRSGGGFMKLGPWVLVS